MKLKAIIISIVVSISLFASGYVVMIQGAAETSKYDLFVFPKYMYGPADKVWHEVMTGIARAEGEYVKAVMHRGRVSPDHKERLTAFRDEAIYWHAVAKVLIYHSDFDAARAAGKKAEALLQQMAGLVLGEKV